MTAPPSVLSGGMSPALGRGCALSCIAALGIIRALSRIAWDADCVEDGIRFVFDAAYGYLIKYNKPMSRGEAGRMLTPAPLFARVDWPPPPPAAAPAPARVDRPQSSCPYSAQRPVPPVDKAARSYWSKEDTFPRPTSPRRRPCFSVESPRNPGSDLIENRGCVWAVGRDGDGSLRRVCKN